MFCCLHRIVRIPQLYLPQQLLQTIDLMHNDVILWSRRLKSFEIKMATLECFENLIWLKITIRTNKLE